MRMGTAGAVVAAALTFAAAQAEEKKAGDGLPRVLLIGDSISIGYTPIVQELLKGKAEVIHPSDNCESTLTGLKKLSEWLGEGRWTVIHFNFGLHDLKHVNAKGERVPVEQGKQLVALDKYEKNLRQLVERLRKTGARLIWCSTTPVPPGAMGRVSGDEAKYNEVAAKVMQESQIAINDLCAVARPRLAELQQPADVHFTPAGYKELAKAVVAAVEKELAK